MKGYLKPKVSKVRQILEIIDLTMLNDSEPRLVSDETWR